MAKHNFKALSQNLLAHVHFPLIMHVCKMWTFAFTEILLRFKIVDSNKMHRGCVTYMESLSV